MNFEELLAGMSEEKRRARLIKFADEDECLTYARKLILNLKPGDTVYVDGTQKCIFREWNNQTAQAMVAYMDEEKNLCSMGAPIGCLTLEPREV